MLSKMLTPDRVQFHDADGWEDAVRRAFVPLTDDGSVEQRYVDTVVSTIKAPKGTYMDLGKGVTLAHSRPENGVHRTAVALLLLEDELDLADDPAHPVRLVIALSSQDTTTHQQTMATIAKLLVDADKRRSLLEATTYEDVLAVTRSAES